MSLRPLIQNSALTRDVLAEKFGDLFYFGAGEPEIGGGDHAVHLSRAESAEQ